MITRTSPTEEVAAFAATFKPAARVQVVGHWVWVEFQAKPNRDTLNRLNGGKGDSWTGFHWNRERGVWQHPCGHFSRHAPYDPRLKYQTEEV